MDLQKTLLPTVVFSKNSTKQFVIPKSRALISYNVTVTIHKYKQM